MAKINVRFLEPLSRKKGPDVYRWLPSKKFRPFGWKLCQLKTYDETWSDLNTAIDQCAWLNTILDYWAAEDLNKEAELVQAWRNGIETSLTMKHELKMCDFIEYSFPGYGHQKARPRFKSRSLEHLFDLYQESRWFKKLKPKTKSGYRSNFNLLPQTLRAITVNRISRAVVRQTYDAMIEVNGIHVANARIRTLMAVLSYAVEVEWIRPGDNPMRAFKMESPPGRIVIASEEQLYHLIETADSMPGYKGVGDAIMLARWSGQRRSDQVVMTFEETDQEDNLKIFQSKKQKWVRVSIVPELRRRLDNAYRRNKNQFGNLAQRVIEKRVSLKKKYQYLEEFDKGTALIINQRSGLPYHPDQLSKDFAAVRKEAAKTARDVNGLRLADFRDTFVTHLVNNGFTLFEICALTGHSPASVTMIIKAYIDITNDELAIQAGKKLLESIKS